jgi:hypothetical protein
VTTDAEKLCLERAESRYSATITGAEIAQNLIGLVSQHYDGFDPSIGQAMLEAELASRKEVVPNPASVWVCTVETVGGGVSCQGRRQGYYSYQYRQINPILRNGVNIPNFTTGDDLLKLCNSYNKELLNCPFSIVCFWPVDPPSRTSSMEFVDVEIDSESLQFDVSHLWLFYPFE